MKSFLLSVPARVWYGLTFVLLFLTELIIALFVRDRFVRPYMGDVLVTVLICSLLRIVFPRGVKLLPIYVFAFSFFVELLQLIDIVALLGLQDIKFLSVIIGRVFSPADIICYAVGCAAFWGAEKLIKHSVKSINL